MSQSKVNHMKSKNNQNSRKNLNNNCMMMMKMMMVGRNKVTNKMKSNQLQLKKNRNLFKSKKKK
jgi:hypothetical protein